jgi:hypothetical protein
MFLTSALGDLRYSNTLVSVFFAFVLLVSTNPPSGAGGSAPCEDTLYFSRSPLNVVLGQYELASDHAVVRDQNEIVDEKSVEERFENDSAARETAQRLTWLINLDLFLNAHFGGFSVAALHEGIKYKDEYDCSSDAILRKIMRRYRPATGKSIVFLTGQIYQEKDTILFRSQLRPGRVADGRFNERDDLVFRMARPGSAALTLAAPVLNGEVVFSPRLVSAANMKQIEQSFVKSSFTYPQKGGGKPEQIRQEQPDDYDSRGPLVFSVEQIETDGWMRIGIRGTNSTRWIKSDAETSILLRQTFPELFFLQGVSAYLIARSGTLPPASISNLRRSVKNSFSSYLDLSKGKDSGGQRSAALIIRGAASVAIGEATAAGWNEARAEFLEAISIDPENSTARNLAVIAELALCCANGNVPAKEVVDRITEQFQAILTRRPSDQYALKNLQLFFDYLDSSNLTPDRSYARDRDQVKMVRRTLGYCKGSAC